MSGVNHIINRFNSGEAYKDPTFENKDTEPKKKSVKDLVNMFQNKINIITQEVINANEKPNIDKKNNKKIINKIKKMKEKSADKLKRKIAPIPEPKKEIKQELDPNKKSKKKKERQSNKETKQELGPNKKSKKKKDHKSNKEKKQELDPNKKSEETIDENELINILLNDL
jgi:nucleolar protein 6